VRRALIAAGVAALLFFTAFPFAWMIATAFKPPDEIFVSPPEFLPRRITLDNLARLFDETRFAVYMLNSVLVAGTTVLLTLALAVPGAYALTRFRFRGREIITATILLTYMFAPIMIIIPFYVLMRALGLVNTHTGLVLAYTAFCLPFALWLLRTYFQSVPLELEEAAMTDGASRAQTVRHILLPVALPGVVATGTFTFILAWNDYIFTRILISADELKTLPVGVQDLFHSALIDWGLIMAAGVLITIPALAFFIAVQRHLVAGWGSGGLKG
jgi:ABC-type glycerol-3-phosphate transport system permease component